jgi:hypothetical protein
MSTITNSYLNELSGIERSKSISAMPGPKETQCNRRIGMLQQIGQEMQSKIENLTSQGRDADVDEILSNLNNAKLQAIAKRKLRDEAIASREIATMEKVQQEIEQVEIDKATDALKSQLATILSRLPREQRSIFLKGIQMEVNSRETGFQIINELNEENTKNIIMQMLEASIIGSTAELIKVMKMSYENADKIANGILFISMGYFLLPNSCQQALNNVPFFGGIFEIMSYMPKSYQQPVVIASGLSAIAEKAGLVQPLKGVGREIINILAPRAKDMYNALQMVYENVFEPIVDMIQIQWNESVSSDARSETSTIASDSQSDFPNSQSTIDTDSSIFSSQDEIASNFSSQASDNTPGARRRKLNTPESSSGKDYISIGSNQSDATIASVSSDVSSTVTAVSKLYNTVVLAMNAPGSSEAQKVEAVEVAIQQAIPTLEVEGTLGVDANMSEYSHGSSNYSSVERGGKNMRKSKHHKKSTKTKKGKRVIKKRGRKTKKVGKRAKKTLKRYKNKSRR